MSAARNWQDLRRGLVRNGQDLRAKQGGVGGSVHSDSRYLVFRDGICTVDRRASTPSSAPDLIGMPTTAGWCWRRRRPARWAAMPAGDNDRAEAVLLASRRILWPRGVGPEDMDLAGLCRIRQGLNRFSTTGRSESLPMITATFSWRLSLSKAKAPSFPGYNAGTARIFRHCGSPCRAFSFTTKHYLFRL